MVSFLKETANFAAALFVKGAIGAYFLLPRRTRDPFAGVVGWLLYIAIPSRRRIAERNLRRAFGGTKTLAELRQILKDAYRHAVLAFCNALPILRNGRAAFVESVEVRGMEHLRAAMAGRAGVIVVSGHYGGFPLLGVEFPSLGAEFHFLYRRPKNRKLAGMFDEWIAKAGCHVIEDNPRHLAALKCLRVLSRRACVCVLVDQHFPAGVPVKFFDHEAKAGIGAALLSLRSGAPILPVVMARRPAGGYVLTIEEPIAPPRERSREVLAECVQKMTSTVEKWIREDPSQWFWVHRRWKDLDRAEQKGR